MAEMQSKEERQLNAAEIGALAHLYRGEVYRSTIWRTRLDTSTNWAVVTLGVALSISFAAPSASPIPLLLVGVLVFLFMWLEARRYRYFNVWRARARWLETHFYVPILNGTGDYMDRDWQRELADDYLHPEYHVRMITALGRRIRRSYIWILLIQTLAFGAKITVHPTPAKSFSEVMDRADIGPVSGEVVLLMGIVYLLSFCSIGLWSHIHDKKRALLRQSGSSMG